MLCVTESRDARRRRRQRLIIVGIIVFAMLASALAGVVAAFADPIDPSIGPGAAAQRAVSDPLPRISDE